MTRDKFFYLGLAGFALGVFFRSFYDLGASFWKFLIFLAGAILCFRANLRSTSELTIITFVMLIALNISYWTIKVTIKRKNKLQATIGAT